jgi:hypothetical protein
MARTKAPDAPSGPGAFLSALRDPGRGLKERFHSNPIGLAERFGLSLPKKPTVIMRELGLWNDELQERWGDEVPGLRDLVEDVCLLRVTSAVAIANRGGGKSQGVSYIEFFLWMVRDFDCINLGGSEQQANNVYQYLLAYLDTDPFWKTLLDGDTMISESKTIEKAWIKVLTASQKQTRAPHAGGKKAGRSGSRGGLLVIDEEAEAEPDIVRSALPTINTATPSVNVRCSTFHKIGGTFQEVVDDHEEMGYTLYKWDTFDVCAGCPCTGGPMDCQSDEPCFREDHFEDYIDPDTNTLEQRLIHKAYCGGRAKYAKGWVAMDEIKKLWRRLKRNHSHWEVEAMGSRPSSSGFVVKSISEFNNNILAESAASLYIPGNPVTVTIDYGTVACAICVWQMQRTRRGQQHVLLHADELHEVGEQEIFDTALGYCRRYQDDLAELAGDIGGGGAYFNPKFEKEYRLPVRGVNFNTDKEAAVSVFNIQNENNDVVIPAEHDDFIRQVRKWKRNGAGHIIKGDDHLCDSAIVCYFSKFIDMMDLDHLRVSARGFDKAPNLKALEPPRPSEAHSHGRTGGHRPMARSFGAGRGRR